MAGRKRDEAARQAILQSTFELMREEGFSRLSIEGVAACAGVGKATIYRWWAGKGALAVEAFLTAAEPLIAFPTSGSARDDIVRQMRLLAEFYRGPAGRLVREMIGAAQCDATIRTAFMSDFLEPRRELARAVFRRGVAAGEFRADVDADVAIDALWSPIYYRFLVSGAGMEDAFISAHAEIVLRGLMVDGV